MISNTPSVIWMFPVALLIHEVEEWNILKWYDRHFIDMPINKSNKSTRFFLIFISVICFIWTWIAMIPQEGEFASLILLPFVAIVLQNIFQHIYWAILFRSYAPGIISALTLLLPISLYILADVINKYNFSFWIVLLMSFYLIMGTRGTIKSKNTLTPSFQHINHFSNYMIDVLKINKSE